MKFKLLMIILLLNFSLVNGEGKKVDQNTIHKNLRCLVCQNQSLAESDSSLAKDLRVKVKNMLDDGKSEEQGWIVDE